VYAALDASMVQFDPIVEVLAVADVNPLQ
jgi:hypothetical protein